MEQNVSAPGSYMSASFSQQLVFPAYYHLAPHVLGMFSFQLSPTFQ
jgi:hypothetical protein